MLNVILISFISCVFLNNVILVQFLGICPFLGVSKKLNTAIGMGVAVTVVLAMASAVTWVLQTFILDPLGLGYMQTIGFILIIAALVQLVELIIKKLSRPLYQALGVYLPLITTNCAVLGVCLNNMIDYADSLPLSVLNGVMTGLGFTVAICLFAGIRERLETADIPESLQGFPVSLVSAGLVSLTFMAFSGFQI